MKKLQILFLALTVSLISIAQNPTYQQKLFYTCKVWGFVKYFHSRVSVCEVNWDSVLIADLPLVKAAVTKNDFNNALDSMLKAAGPMAITHTPACDTMAPELRRNLNTAWINDTSIFRMDVIAALDTINNNFRPHAECSVEVNPNEADGGWLKFQSGDSLILNVNDYTNYPDEWHRLLETFVYWNIINYFNPYDYIHNEPWDSTLYRNIIPLDNAVNDEQFYYAFKKVTSENVDAHTEGGTWDNYCNLPGGTNAWYSPLLILKYIPNQYVVVKSGVTGINVGDAIVSINGMTTPQWEDSLRPYVSAGDTAVFRRFVSSYMLFGNSGANSTIACLDSLNNTHTIVTKCSEYIYSNWLDLYDYVNGYFPNDTLGSATYKLWNNCNIGYVNMGELQTTDVNNMYSALQNTSAIIFDLRDYPNGTAWPITDLMYANFMNNSKFLMPDPTYPGTGYWYFQGNGTNGNPTPYLGRVILLFNEVTQSQAKFSCMMLGAMPNVTKIGSQTAGTDGDVTYFDISQDMATMFTTLNTYYPNGDSTERVGIIPDTIVFPTRVGLYHGRDEVLEKALQVVGCATSVPTVTAAQPNILVYPNPSSTEVAFKLSSGDNRYIKVSDITGREIKTVPINNNTCQIYINNYPAGMYLYEIMDEANNVVVRGKFSVIK